MRNRNNSGIMVFIGALAGFLMLAILIGVLVLFLSDKASAQEQIVGIGVKLDISEVTLVTEDGTKVGSLGMSAEVVAVFPGSPAETAGLMAGDSIIAINGRDVKQMNENEVGNSIRGEEGTYVEINISRLLKKDGEINPDKDIVEYSFKIKREKIKTD